MADRDPENSSGCVEGPEALDAFRRLAQRLVHGPKGQVEMAGAEMKAPGG